MRSHILRDEESRSGSCGWSKRTMGNDSVNPQNCTFSHWNTSTGNRWRRTRHHSFVHFSSTYALAHLFESWKASAQGATKLLTRRIIRSPTATQAPGMDDAESSITPWSASLSLGAHPATFICIQNVSPYYLTLSHFLIVNWVQEPILLTVFQSAGPLGRHIVSVQFLSLFAKKWFHRHYILRLVAWGLSTGEKPRRSAVTSYGVKTGRSPKQVLALCLKHTWGLWENR